jgi:hypothetical protein
VKEQLLMLKGNFVEIELLIDMSNVICEIKIELDYDVIQDVDLNNQLVE